MGNEVRCIAEEVPFDIPDNWEWMRLGNIGITQTGNTPSKAHLEYFNGKTPFISPADILNFNINYNNQSLSNIGKKYGRICSKGSILQVCIGGSIGKLAITNMEIAFNQQINSITPLYCSELYLFYVMDTQYFYQLLKEKSGGTATPIINRGVWDTLLIPLPPIEEQQRIVNKLKELEPYINDYDKAYEKIEKLNTDFPDLLKKSILQDAVQGKLVPQNPKDEPASVLIERIREEKQKLIKEKKIKKDKNESYIFRRDNSHYEKIGNEERCIDDEIPFEIPDNWEWVRLKNILEIARGGSPRPIQAFLTTKENGIPWIKIGDTNKGEKYINSTKEFIVPEGIHKSRMVYKGDFLLTNSMSFGRPYILNIDGCIHDGWLVLSNLYNAFYIDYLYYLLSSTYVYYQFCNSVSGAVVKNLNSDKVANALIPLPPLAEQQRIVEKIEQLLPEIKTLQK